MGLKKIKTGIFEHYVCKGIITERDQATLRKNTKANWPIEHWLEDFEIEASRILTQYLPGWESLSIKELCANVPENEYPIAADAFGVLCLVRLVRHYLDEYDAERAVLYAIELSETAMMMTIRPHEKPAVTGRKVMRITAAGRSSEALRLAKARKAAEYKEWEEVARKYRQKHPKSSDRDIARRVAEEVSQKFETVRHALRKI